MRIMPDHIQSTGSRANQEFEAHYQNPFSEENICVDGGENSAIKITKKVTVIEAAYWISTT